MAQTSSPQDERFTEVIYKDTAADNTGTADVHGKGACSVISVDYNSAATQVGYLKIYNAVSAIVTDLPVMILRSAASTRTLWHFKNADFSAGCTYRCVNAAGTPGATTPTGGATTITTHTTDL